MLFGPVGYLNVEVTEHFVSDPLLLQTYTAKSTGASRVKCLVQGHTTQWSAEVRIHDLQGFAAIARSVNTARSQYDIYCTDPTVG